MSPCEKSGRQNLRKGLADGRHSTRVWHFYETERFGCAARRLIWEISSKQKRGSIDEHIISKKTRPGDAEANDLTAIIDDGEPGLNRKR